MIYTYLADAGSDACLEHAQWDCDGSQMDCYCGNEVWMCLDAVMCDWQDILIKIDLDASIILTGRFFDV